jgi:ABC-type phosphate transport system substrate-binding protein
MKLLKWFFLSLAFLTFIGLGKSYGANINGAGATFLYPVYTKWAFKNCDKAAESLGYVPLPQSNKNFIFKYLSENKF